MLRFLVKRANKTPRIKHWLLFNDKSFELKAIHLEKVEHFTYILIKEHTKQVSYEFQKICSQNMFSKPPPQAPPLCRPWSCRIHQSCSFQYSFERVYMISLLKQTRIFKKKFKVAYTTVTNSQNQSSYNYVTEISDLIQIFTFKTIGKICSSVFMHHYVFVTCGCFIVSVVMGVSDLHQSKGGSFIWSISVHGWWKMSLNITEK